MWYGERNPGDPTMRSRLALATCAALLSTACGGTKQAPAPTLDVAVIWAGGGGRAVLTDTGLPAQVAGAPVTVTARFALVRDLAGGAQAAAAVEVPATIATAPSGVVQVTLQIPAGALAAGVHRLEVDASSGGAVRLEEALLALPTPALGTPEKTYGCTGTVTPVPALAADGTDLPLIDGTGPSASLASPVARPIHLITSQCQVVPYARARVSLCRHLQAFSDADLPAMETSVEVHWPAPLDAAPAGLGRFSVLDPPELSPGPPRRGKGLPIDTPATFYARPAWPLVATLGGQAVAVAPSEGCFEVPSLGISRCFGLNLTIPAGLAAGPQELVLTAAPGCSGRTTVDVGPLPVVSSVAPQPFCSGGFLTIAGSGFLGAQATIGGGLPVATACANGLAEPCARLVQPVGGLTAGTFDLVVTNQTSPPTSSTARSITVALPVEAGQAVPTLVSGLASRELFIPILRATGAISGVVLLPPPDGLSAPPPVVLPFSEVPGGVRATLPATLAKGQYNLLVQDQGPCPYDQGQLESKGQATVMQLDFEDGSLPVSSSWRWPIGGGDGSTGPDLQLAAGEGHPGTAARAGEAASAVPWYFPLPLLPSAPGADAGSLRFDLRVEGTGAPVDAPHVIVTAAAAGVPVRLEHALSAPPSAAWTSYQLRFDDPAGWVVRDHLGTHAATAAELSAAVLGSLNAAYVLGAWTDGANQAWLDNVVLELAQ